MSDVTVALRRRVEGRAGGRCEYCLLAQVGQEARFHLDHVYPLAAGGPTTFENLALACVSCSLRKGARRLATDTLTSTDVPLYNPRVERWADHFRWDGPTVVALTPTGRATLAALSLNRSLIVAIRREETERSRHPPPNSPQ